MKPLTLRTPPRPALHRCAWAVRAALAAFTTLPAQAQTPPGEDPALTALTRARSEVEVGLRVANAAPAKANEYSGWTGKGPRLFGNFDLRGGGQHDSSDLTRWRVSGTQLGSRSGALDAEFGEQGRYRLTAGVDELRRWQSDSFQTPYAGAGSAVLGLPAGWIVPLVPRVSTTAPNARGLSPDVTSSNAIVGGVSLAPTAAMNATAAALQGADLPAFQRVDLYTQRTKATLGWQQQLAPGWSWNAALARERTTGIKAMPAHSRAVGGDTSSVLPGPVDQDDTTLQLGLAYTAEAWQMQAAYEASRFDNHVASVGWNLWASPTTTAAIGMAPSNRFRKLGLSASGRLATGTTLQAHASHSQATQDERFLSDNTAPWVPVASAQARVIGDSAGIKLQHQATPKLQLGAGYKLDQRDNRTPVNLYGYYDNNNPAAGTSPFAYVFPTLSGLGSNFNINANTPYSRRSQEVALDAAYRYTAGRQARLEWKTEQVERHCTGSWINCADAPRSTEHTLRGDWHGPLAEELTGRVQLAGARRTVDYDENAFLAVVPMAGRTPATATGALAGTTALGALQQLGLTGYGPVLGLTPVSPATSLLGFYFPANNVLSNTLYGNQNRISELVGMRRYNQADRNRASLQASLDWAPGERWQLQAAAQGSSDHYDRSVYGLQRGSRAALHLDAGYAIDDRLVVNAFMSGEDQRTRMASNSYTANSTAANVNGATAIVGGCYATIALRNANNKIDPCLDWRAASRDRTVTLGAGFVARRLMAGQLDLEGSLAWSDGRHDTDVTGGSYVNNPYAGIATQATATTAATFIAASALPTTTARSLQLRLASTWQLAPQHAVRLAYGYARLRSDDWRYEGLQDGSLTQVLPSHEQAPRHEVHSVGLSYVAGF